MKMSLSFIGAIKRRTIVRDLTVGLTITIVLVTATVSLLYYVSSTSSADVITSYSIHYTKLYEKLQVWL